jgi:hypothetical protein
MTRREGTKVLTPLAQALSHPHRRVRADAAWGVPTWHGRRRNDIGPVGHVAEMASSEVGDTLVTRSPLPARASCCTLHSKAARRKRE